MPHTSGNWNISRHATPEHSPQFGIYSEDFPNKDIAIIVGENAEADAKIMASSPLLLAIALRLFHSVNGLSATFSAVNRDYACSQLRKELTETIREAQNAIAETKP